MLFKLILWLFDLSGERVKEIRNQAVRDYLDANLFRIKRQAIDEWWKANKGPKMAELRATAIREYCEGRPVITAELQQGTDKKWRCVLREDDGDPILVSAGFGYRDKTRMTSKVYQVEMVSFQFKELPPKTAHPATNGNGVEPHEE